MGEFHAPEDYRATVTAAVGASGAEVDLAPVEVPAGGGSFHHGWTWHDSGPNESDRHRRALVLQSEAAMGPASFFLTDDAVIAERMHRAFEGAAVGDDGWVDLSRGLEREQSADGQRWSDITDETTNRGFWHHYLEVMAGAAGDRHNGV